MQRGVFITFEGGEGTGKSTQIARLGEHLRGRGFEVVITREPGGTPVAEAARAILLDPELDPDPLSELFLLAAARRDLVERVIRPALERGAVVLCDRYTDSSVVYQGMVGGVGREAVEEINRLATGGLVPGRTFLLDLDPETGMERTRRRNGAVGGRSRFDEKPLQFHRRVRDAYLELALEDTVRFRVLPAEEDEETLFGRLLEELPEGLR
ncbi:MAG: dTMP kinase [Acidobacteria bacterium]|nr:dTMP kinase [Acidobacteriota bacterium]